MKKIHIFFSDYDEDGANYRLTESGRGADRVIYCFTDIFYAVRHYLERTNAKHTTIATSPPKKRPDKSDRPLNKEEVKELKGYFNVTIEE